MSRRRRSASNPAEHVFTQQLDFRCPVNDAHPLGVVFRDMVETRIHPAADKSATVVNSPSVPFARKAGVLAAICPACRRASSGAVRTAPQVRWERVEALLDLLREHGPDGLKVRLDVAAMERAAREIVERAQRPPAQASPPRPRKIRPGPEIDPDDPPRTFVTSRSW